MSSEVNPVPTTATATDPATDYKAAAWLEAGRPSHPMLERVLGQLRQHVARLGHAPEWLQPRLAEALEVRDEAADALYWMGICAEADVAHFFSKMFMVAESFLEMSDRKLTEQIAI